MARARLLERQQTAAAEREVREWANIGDMTEFTVQAAHADEVDEWLAARIEKLKAEAERRRHRYRVAAGKALHTMRLRGESVTTIAAQTGLSLGRVREYLRVAADAETDTQVEPSAVEAQIVPIPSHHAMATGVHAAGEAIVGAQ